MRASCIVEIRADDGTTGWGECYGPARINAAIVAAFKGRLIGRDPRATDVIWMDLYNHFRDYGQKGVVISAISGIDIALWDIKGRHFGVPASMLLGGATRTAVDAYATGTYRRGTGDPLDYIVEEVKGTCRRVQGRQAEDRLRRGAGCRAHQVPCARRSGRASA